MEKELKKDCDMCGVCCNLFLINLNEEEYKSGKYETMFQEFGVMVFAEAKECGANLLAQKSDGSCIYLSNNICGIHKTRPQVCREFFCGLKDKKFKKMQEVINSNR